MSTLEPKQVEAAQSSAMAVNQSALLGSLVKVNLPRAMQWASDTIMNNLRTSDAPALAVFRNRLYCVHRGVDRDSQAPWYSSFDGSSWSKDTKIANVGITGAPAIAVFNNRLYCVHRGMGGDDKSLWYTSFDGLYWSRDTKIANVGISGAPALIVFNGQLYCMHQGVDHSGQTFWYIRGTESSNLLLPIQRPFGLLDVWGEGRIVAGGIVTGFALAYNLNKYDQKISNGPQRGQPIPDLIVVKNMDK